MSAALEGLLARVEAATGPDRELDGLLLCATSKGLSLGKNQLGGPIVQHVDGMRWHLDDAAPRYTASIDAAVALVEHVLPGVKWSTGVYSSKAHAFLHLTPDAEDTGAIYSQAATPAIALVAILLRALLASSAPAASSATAGETEGV